VAILTISREFMSGGEEIGQAVAKTLNYDYVDRDHILLDMTRDGEKWRNLGAELDEASPSIWERFDWEYRGFVALLESYIYDYALKDKVVIMGRASNILLQDIPLALTIRLTASLDKRIERAMSKHHFDKETAKSVIMKADGSSSRYVHVNYGSRWDDLSQYDMVFNTGTQSYDHITKILIAELEERDRNATPEIKKKLMERALASKIKAKIGTDPRFLVPTLDVSIQEGTIILRGVVHSHEEHQLIEEIARKTAEGLNPVKNELHYRTT
jgi:cytidylate kinase